MASRVLFISQGRMVFDGPIKEVTRGRQIARPTIPRVDRRVGEELRRNQERTRSSWRSRQGRGAHGRRRLFVYPVRRLGTLTP